MDEIKDYYAELKEKAEKKSEEVKEELKEGVDKAKKKLKKGMKDAEEKVEQLIDKASDAIGGEPKKPPNETFSAKPPPKLYTVSKNDANIEFR